MPEEEERLAALWAIYRRLRRERPAPVPAILAHTCWDKLGIGG